MKIIILGAGQVGSSVAEALSSEANDITVVDTDAARLKSLQDRLDLRTVVGNAAHPKVLAQAGAADADMIFAVTKSDETNLVACKLAAKLFNTPTRIARIRAADYLAREAYRAGIPGNHIVLDPGIGFGKTPEQSMTVLARLDELRRTFGARW